MDAMHIVALFALSAVAMAVGMLKSVPRNLFGVAAMVAMLSLGAWTAMTARRSASRRPYCMA